MRISRVVGAGGIARFADAEITVAGAPGDPAKRSEVLPVTGAMVMEFPEGFTQDWHPAPRRQIGIVLEGAMEIETPDGQKQIRRRYRLGRGYGHDGTSHSHCRRTGACFVSAFTGRGEIRRLTSLRLKSLNRVLGALQICGFYEFTT